MGNSMVKVLDIAVGSALCQLDGSTIGRPLGWWLEPAFHPEIGKGDESDFGSVVGAALGKTYGGIAGPPQGGWLGLGGWALGSAVESELDNVSG
jgi:hypothetical protein